MSKPLTYSPKGKKTPGQLAAEKENARVKAERQRPGGRPSERAIAASDRLPLDGTDTRTATAPRVGPGPRDPSAEPTVKVVPARVAVTADAQLAMVMNQKAALVPASMVEATFGEVDAAFTRIASLMSRPMSADALAVLHFKLAALKREGGVLDSCAKAVKDAISSTMGTSTVGSLGRYQVSKTTSYRKPVPEDLVRTFPFLKLEDVANQLIQWELSESKVRQLIDMGKLTEEQVDSVRKVHATTVKVSE